MLLRRSRSPESDPAEQELRYVSRAQSEVKEATGRTRMTKSEVRIEGRNVEGPNSDFSLRA
jgi:hypothetical protein